MDTREREFWGKFGDGDDGEALRELSRFSRRGEVLLLMVVLQGEICAIMIGCGDWKMVGDAEMSIECVYVKKGKKKKGQTSR